MTLATVAVAKNIKYATADKNKESWLYMLELENMEKELEPFSKLITEMGNSL